MNISAKNRISCHHQNRYELIETHASETQWAPSGTQSEGSASSHLVRTSLIYYALSLDATVFILFIAKNQNTTSVVGAGKRKDASLLEEH